MRHLPRFSIIHAVALLFSIQALLLAFFVTPLGDLPDESGHYAYVIDMTKGRPLPILGKAEIPSDLWKQFEGMPEVHRKNYIVQHPPLYYAVAAIPYALAKKFTDNKEILSRAPRVVSALSLGFLILVLYQTMRAAQISPSSALMGSALVGFVPMLSNMASGITNDVFLFLLCALASRHLVRFLMGQRIIDAYACALWLTLAGATKMTAWVFLAGCLGVLLFEMRRPLKSWVLHAVGVSALALALPAWWMRRNHFLFGDPFKVNLATHEPYAPTYTAFDYLRFQPFFEWIYAHFYGLFGFTGYCHSAESYEQLLKYCTGGQITRIGGPSFTLFVLMTTVSALVFLGAALYLILRARPSASDDGTTASPQAWLSGKLQSWHLGRFSLVLGVASGATLLAFLLNYSFRPAGLMNLGIVMTFALLLSLSLAGTTYLVNEGNITNRLVFYGPVLISLFILLLFMKGLEAYRLVATPAGLQGRYLYPFLPLLAVAFVLALERLGHLRWLLLPLLLLLAWAHANAYIAVVLPFFNLVRI